MWKKQQSNRFIESLLLGLPVPGIFLVKEPDGKLLVLDGHQRLQTLRRYYDNDWEGKAYALEGVQDRFENRTYEATGVGRQSPPRRQHHPRDSGEAG